MDYEDAHYYQLQWLAVLLDIHLQEAMNELHVHVGRARKTVLFSNCDSEEPA